MRLDDLELLLGQPAGLEQDRVRDRDLADVVQRRGAGGPARPSRSPQAELAGEPRGELARRAACARACCRRGTRRRRSRRRERVELRAARPRAGAATRLGGDDAPRARLCARAARAARRTRAAAARRPAPSASSAATSRRRDHGRPSLQAAAGPAGRAGPPRRPRRARARRRAALGGDAPRRPRRYRRASAGASAPARPAGRAAGRRRARSSPATSTSDPRASASSILDRIMADATDDRRIGTVIAGYRIEARIGRGGMGVVYRAHHLNLEREAAVKIIAPDLAESSGFRERFTREARIAAALAAPEHRHRLRRGRGRRHAVPGDAVHRGLRPRARCCATDGPPAALPRDRRLPPGRRRARRRPRAWA